MKMIKTSLALVAALAATTVLSPAYGNSYLATQEGLADLSGGGSFSVEAIANMTDDQCRDYVTMNVRAMENYQGTVRELRRYEGTIDETFEDEKQLRNSAKTFYGMPTNEDYALTVGRATGLVKLNGKVVISAIPDGPAKKGLTHAMRAAEAVGENNANLVGAGKSFAMKEAVALGVGKTGIDPSGVGMLGYGLNKDIWNLANMDKEHGKTKDVFSGQMDRILKSRNREAELFAAATRRLAEIDAKAKAAVARYCGEGQAVKVLGASEMGLSISNYRWDPKNFQLPEPSRPTPRPALPTDVRAPEYNFSPKPVSKTPTPAPVKRCWREIETPGCR